MGRARGGLTTKIHALVAAERRPRPPRPDAWPGQAGDAAAAPGLIVNLGPGAIAIADRAYDTNAIRHHATRRGVWAIVPPASSAASAFSALLYRYHDR
ncbi:hypothetical protein [Acuticoccus sp.]|uniref:hypothetical protein n=1 Tax=Acuticoccus sp. TaxID=1904378 RepID=UPI003B52B94F